MISFRPLDTESDFPRLAQLLSAVENEPTTVEMLREREQVVYEGAIRERTAVVQDGLLVGFYDMLRLPWFVPGEFRFALAVDEGFRGRGIGTSLYDNAYRFAVGRGATQLKIRIMDNCPECLRFAEHRGFTIERHTFFSTLDLESFDESRFAGCVEAAEKSGFRFFSLADVGNTPEAQCKLYEVNRQAALDNPASDGTFLPYDEFSQVLFKADWFRADGQILASYGDEWAGLASVIYHPENNMAYNGFTGVLRAYRGRGLALALKLLVIRRAHEYGAPEMKTNNDSQNGPMLAINRKLGYRPEPGAYRMIKKIVPAESGR